MFAVELKFQRLKSGKKNTQNDAIICLLGSLGRNGSLKDDFLVEGKSDWTVFGLAPAKDAFRKANWSEYVKQRMGELKAGGLTAPAIRFLGIVPETAAACRCGRSSGYYLFTTYLHVETPLRCIDCGDIVPLYRIPRLAKGELYGLHAWRTDYRACDALQMNCTVGERFAIRQMSDLKSKLTQSGLAVCKEIEGLTGSPAYYYLFRDKGRSVAAENARKCPGCGGEWLLTEPLHRLFDLKCDKCHLLSNIAWDLR